jgi:hypothetical protein
MSEEIDEREFVKLALRASEDAELGDFATDLPVVSSRFDSLGSIARAVVLDDVGQVLMPVALASEPVPWARNKLRALVEVAEDFALLGFGKQLTE